MFDVYPQTVVHDLHPRYLSTQYAKSKDFLKKISVQHHHAHIVSLMEDRGLDGDVIGVALDGVGYGSDGNLWGFEFMRANFEDFDRFIHLKYAKMPGGEKSVKEPWRMAMSYVYDALGEHMFDIDFPFLRLIERKKIKFVKKMLNSSMKMPLISSAGRLFDAVSAMLGIRCLCNYEGQAAIEMEMLAAAEREDFYAFNIDRNVFPMVIKPDGIIRGIADDIVNGENLSGMAGKFHNSIAEIVTEGCLIISGITGLKRVALSGGVFQNMLLLEKCINRLEKSGFSVYIHQRVPTNDGGISLGQAAIAAKKLKMESC